MNYNIYNKCICTFDSDKFWNSYSGIVVKILLYCVQCPDSCKKVDRCL